MKVEEIDYLEDAGPGIPELPPAPAAVPPPAGAPPVEAGPPGWEQDTIETFLRGTGAGIHMLIGQTEADWLMTDEDLKRIAPPLTRICNRWEPALRLSPVADPLLVAHGFALYGWRSALERRRAQREAEEQLHEAVGYETGPVEEMPAEPAAQAENIRADGGAERQAGDGLEAAPYFPESRRAA